MQAVQAAGRRRAQCLGAVDPARFGPLGQYRRQAVEGMPKLCATSRIVADAVSAAKPLIGCSFTILWPSVLMMRQPPTAVPAAITSAHETLTQSAMSGVLPSAPTGV